MPTQEEKEYHNWFMKTPASIIVNKWQLKQYEFNLWLQDELQPLEKDLQDLYNAFKINGDYLDKNYDRKLLLYWLYKRIKDLDSRQKTVLYYRFWEDKTLDEIGDIIGKCRKTVRKIECEVLRKLRYPQISKHYRLKDYGYIFE